ncbi:MAG TPA: hypothetical protein VKP65_22775, partial [Rhodothermales bacterium]|nr:hypothetical protein [Rhodothermales bacterium]
MSGSGSVEAATSLGGAATDAGAVVRRGAGGFADGMPGLPARASSRASISSIQLFAGPAGATGRGVEAALLFPL